MKQISLFILFSVVLLGVFGHSVYEQEKYKYESDGVVSDDQFFRNMVKSSPSTRYLLD